jgi:hypothetical protein
MPTLRSSDIDQAHQYFDQTRNAVLAATTGLTDGQWSFKPDPESWSIAEILEHMVIVQDRVLGPLQALLAQAPAPSAGQRELDAIVLEKIPDRSIKAKAPDVINPTGQLTLPDALDRLCRNYQRLAGWVESTPDLREHVLESAPLKIVTNGAHHAMDGFQWALTAAAHDQRHVYQILEVKADPNYPAA